MKGEQNKSLIIGTFVLIATALVVWGIFFLNPTVGDGAQTLLVRFTNIDKINVGTRVTFAGKPVGEVIKISEVFDARQQSQNNDRNDVFFYELKLQVDSSVQVYDRDIISIHTSGLLGERSIAIIPRPPSPNRTPQLLNDNVLYSQPSASVESALEEIGSLAAKAHKTMDSFIQVIEENRDALNNSINSISTAAQSLDVTLKSVHSENLVPAIKAATSNASEGFKAISDLIKDLESKGMWSNLAQISTNIESITSSLNQPKVLQEIVDNVNTLAKGLSLLESKVSASWPTIDLAIGDLRSATAHVSLLAGQSATVMGALSQGKGTLGKLIMNDSLYLRTESLMGRLETVVSDINHYGILFQNNQNWQRLRLKRMSHLTELSSPEGFRDFFSEEMSQINASLTRVNILLERVEGDKNRDLLENPALTKTFADLLRQVQGIEASLKLFNEKMVDESNNVK